MVGSPCLATANLPILSRLSRKAQTRAGGLGLADVCCDWHWQVATAAILVCPMDPRKVLKHCHNNGWLSLPRNSQFANPVQTLQKGPNEGRWPRSGRCLL